MKSKKAFYRFREDTSWSKTGKFGQFLTTFGDMENGWKKSFRPPPPPPPKGQEFRDNCAPRTCVDHPDHHAQPCLTFQGSIRSAPFVTIHTCRRDSDLSMAGPRQIASQLAGRLRMLDFKCPNAFGVSVIQPTLGSRLGAQRIARTLSVFEERSGSLVPSLKGRKARVWVSKSSSKTSQAPSFHLRRRVFARETLRSS